MVRTFTYTRNLLTSPTARTDAVNEVDVLRSPGEEINRETVGLTTGVEEDVVQEYML